MNMNWFVFVTVAFITFSATQEQETVAIRPYNKRDELCCNTNIFNKTRRGHMCCDDKVFNMRKELCCEGNVYKRNESRYECCCGKTAIDMTVQTCCSGEVLQYPTDYAFQCCGIERYNISEEVCCNGHRIPFKPEYISYQGPFATCCGNQAMDEDKQVCCEVEGQMQIIDKTSPEQTECCNGKLYIPITHLCCNDKIVEKSQPRDTKCCGNITYSEHVGLCCEEGNQTIFHPNAINRWLLCCGLQPYNFEDFSCCANKVTYAKNYEICCTEVDPSGSVIKALVYKYRRDAQCCGAQVYENNDNQTCCGNKIFNPTVDECCGDILVKKAEDEKHTSCCINYDEDRYQRHSVCRMNFG